MTRYKFHEFVGIQESTFEKLLELAKHFGTSKDDMADKAINEKYDRTLGRKKRGDRNE